MMSGITYDPEYYINKASVDFDYSAIDTTLADADAYKEAAVLFLEKMDELIFLLLQKQPKNSSVWGLALALGSKHLQGRSMTDIASYLGVSRAAISKQANYFINNTGLPPSVYMSPNMKRPGKESDKKRASRLVQQMNISELPDSLIKEVNDYFYLRLAHCLSLLVDKNNPAGPVYPNEYIGKIYRLKAVVEGCIAYTDMQYVFIPNEQLKNFLGSRYNIQDIIKILYNNSMIKDLKAIKSINSKRHNGVIFIVSSWGGV